MNNIKIVYMAKKFYADILVEPNTNLEQALTIINFYNKFPEAINLQVGVFAKIKNPSAYILQDKDRIEIYSPLLADPKEQRQKRAEKKRLANVQEKSKWKA
jgi:uncharacterized protein